MGAILSSDLIWFDMNAYPDSKPKTILAYNLINDSIIPIKKALDGSSIINIFCLKEAKNSYKNDHLLIEPFSFKGKL